MRGRRGVKGEEDVMPQTGEGKWEDESEVSDEESKR